ncbi:MAG TPA: glutamate formimidoyltransferase [Saprospirales bacterium]|nr:glutamate formimidoyltransferase [Saprospirales bacterium]HAY72137.1 glutamate formimidoyltransferase [Saprospirales bacterium]HRQ30603.1 glutamate formimidoyltransferase [Saprospiraceae bacterium]
MAANRLIECVPNFSEGRDMHIIQQITDEIKTVEGVQLLNVDPGKATNRTVVTFVGEPGQVIEAAFRAIKKAGEVIDMSKHSGEHPRMGATDVCPLIPISGISMEEVVKYALQLAKRVGEELSIPVYCYEEAAQKPDRKNLATIRAGEYEGLAKKLEDLNWQPDFGKAVFNPKSGATVIGARDFLVAYNINLNTTSTRRANSIAFDLRENGRILREGDPVTGKVILDENGEPKRQPGVLKSVKAIGWYIEEYGIAQVSMNLTNIEITPLHVAFDEAVKSATSRGIRVTGSELVGLVPKKVLTDAGKYFLEKQERSVGVSESELIHIAVKSLGLDELAPFNPRERVIEYLLEDPAQKALVSKDLEAFADATASESPAPGGGSIAAYVGALGASLGAMVGNLSSHKPGWDDRWAYFSEWAAKGQALKEELLFLVDEDTRAFNAIIDAVRMPKATDDEKKSRSEAMKQATKYAIEVPFRVMETAWKSFEVLEEMTAHGNPNSVSDAGVGVLCAKTAVFGAYLNVMINCMGLKDPDFVNDMQSRANAMLENAVKKEQEIMDAVKAKIGI